MECKFVRWWALRCMGDFALAEWIFHGQLCLEVSKRDRVSAQSAGWVLVFFARLSDAGCTNRVSRFGISAFRNFGISV